MFEWRVNRMYSNVVKKNGYRYQLCYSHTVEYVQPVSMEYFIMENGYPLKSIHCENEDFNEVILDGNTALNDIGTCQKCREVKMLRLFDETYKCEACTHSVAFKKAIEEGRVKINGNRETPILFFKNDSEAEVILREIIIPEIFKDHSNEDYIYVKGIFKVPLMDDVGYKYYPAFFHLDCINYDLYNIYFLKSNFRERIQGVKWVTAVDAYSSYYMICRIARVVDPISCIMENFEPFEFQLGEYRTISYLPIKSKQRLWPNYYKF